METDATTARPKAHLTVGEIAAMSSVASSAVRFYEKHGLITSERTSGNQRRFRSQDSCRIKIIRVAQRVGLTVAEIKDLLSELPEEREPSLNDWQRLTQRLENEVAQRIEQLQNVLADVTSGEKLCELPPVSRPKSELSGAVPR